MPQDVEGTYKSHLTIHCLKKEAQVIVKTNITFSNVYLFTHYYSNLCV